VDAPENLDLGFSSDDESTDGTRRLKEGKTLSRELTTLSFGSPLNFPLPQSNPTLDAPDWMLPEAAQVLAQVAAKAVAEAALIAYQSRESSQQITHESPFVSTSSTSSTSSGSVTMSSTAPTKVKIEPGTTKSAPSRASTAKQFEMKPHSSSAVLLARLPTLGEAPKWPDTPHDRWAGFSERAQSDRPSLDDPFVDEGFHTVTETSPFRNLQLLKEESKEEEVKDDVRSRRPLGSLTNGNKAPRVKSNKVKKEQIKQLTGNFKQGTVAQGIVKPVKDLVVKMEEDASSDEEETPVQTVKVAKRRGRTRRCEAPVKIDKITEINVSLRALHDLPCDLYGVRNEDAVTCGVYTPAERKAKIEKWQRKKEAIYEAAGKDRVIMYGCRKKFADKRPRIGGRFVRSPEVPEG
jgi:hypothetical protein